MSRAQIAMLVWGALLLVLAAIMWSVFWADTLSFVLPTASTLLTWGIAVWAIRWDGRRREVERVTDLSPPTALAAVGLSMAVVGAEAGPWLVAMGAGVFVAGVVGLIHEERAR
jgi:hypothetical protein